MTDLNALKMVLRRSAGKRERGGCEEEVQILKITGRCAVVTGEDPGAVAPILQPVSTGVIAMNGW